MGISAKECKSPIGLYGTGLKYAIAVLLRTGHSVTIKTETDEYRFGVTDINFRGKDFQLITCNGKELPFTTEYGKLWEVWMAYRELVSNTLDEGGLHFAGEPFDHGTSIIVEGAELHECLTNHHRYFVGDREPIAECHKMKVYHGDGTIYYRGVRVSSVKDAMYSYELLNELTLTEDRTVKDEYRIGSQVGWAFASEIKDKEILRRVITAKKRWETDLDYDWSWSPEMNEVAQDVWENAPTTLNNSIANLLKKKQPDAGFTLLEFDDDQSVMLDAAKEFLSKAGYEVTALTRLVSNEDSTNIAFVHKEEIYLTPKAFAMGLFFLTVVLLEEHHHTVGWNDESRGYQTHLLEELVGQAKKRLRIAL